MGLDNPLHLALIALVIVLLFGAKRLPELGRSLGGGIREFKGSLTGEDDDDKDKDKDQPAVVAAAAAAPVAPPAPAPVASPAPPPVAPAAPVADQESSVGLS